MHLGVEANLAKERGIAERSEEFSCQDGFEVDRLCRAVIERDAEHVGADDLEATNAVDGVVHSSSYFSGSMACGGRPACRRSQATISSPGGAPPRLRRVAAAVEATCRRSTRPGQCRRWPRRPDSTRGSERNGEGHRSRRTCE